MNVIFGENAQGKTNLLEAIWLFTGAKSFRGAKDSSFIRLEREKAVCELAFKADETEYTAKMEFSEKRTAFLNETQLKSPAGLAGSFSAVVFSPLDLALVNDGPAARRKFLDIAIGQLYPNYITLLHSYNKAVSQRNQVLRDYRYNFSLEVMLEIFEKEIADKGKRIVMLRRRYTEHLKKYIPDIYSGLSGGRESLSAEYICSAEPENIEQALFRARAEDSQSGITSVGPHRDDISFLIDELAVRGYGSQGQKRSTALAVKLAQAEVINSISGEYPVCLLDDVMSELDPIRQEYILNKVRNWQTFLTCCDPNNFNGLKNGKSFEIKGGAIAEV